MKVYAVDNTSTAYILSSILYNIDDRQASGRADFC